MTDGFEIGDYVIVFDQYNPRHYKGYVVACYPHSISVRIGQCKSITTPTRYVEHLNHRPLSKNDGSVIIMNDLEKLNGRDRKL